MAHTEKKNFLFDLTASQPNESGAYHGGGKYAKKIYFEFIENFDTSRWAIWALFDSSKPLDAEISEKSKTAAVTLIDVANRNLPEVVNELSIHRFYSALPLGTISYGFNSLMNSACEIYGTIHGLRTLETKIPFDALRYETGMKGKAGLLARKFLEKKLYNRDLERYGSLLKNTNVLAVSNHTKYSILSHFPAVREVPRVFYSPDVTEFENRDEDDSKGFALSGYFLLISGNRWLKNNLRSAVALDQLFSEQPALRHQVVVTGVSQPEIFLSRIKNKDRFIFYKYVSEGFLQTLYKNAFAFLYMTLNEGFGYPPLEAMKAGTPVITSPFTSIMEICGDSVLYSDPYSIAEIKNRILQITDPDSHRNFTIAGKNRYEKIKERQDKDLKEMVTYLLA
ncbi:Glycosyl transferases group 1 [Dyadobacter soli]|uniref:Glycosyl transferases group 1 n=1 Tax=Dyadobacter soli TaxID=659014 RepID=A0A1G6YBA9_9BACT|nr:glycosyltransferase [Dyadobacter soli]SDD87668.1 Glycosyl transferases group 1 [Dyadobacter soli]